MFLAKGIYEKYGHRTRESVAAAATAKDEIAVKDHVFEALREAAAFVTTNGRPNNHLLVVRQLLFTVASARLTPRLRSVAGDLLRVDPRIFRTYRHALDDLVSGTQKLWYQERGQQRSTGRFSKTSPVALYAARLHWEATAVPSANKQDTYRDPSNSKERSIIM